MIKLFKKYYSLLRQMFLYGVIGLIAAGCDSLLFIGLESLNLNQYATNFISVNVGITISFLLNSYINFKMTTKMGKRAVRFFIIGYIGLGLSTAILYLGTDVAGLDSTLIKLVSVVIVAAFQFVLNKLITFKGKSEENG